MGTMGFNRNVFVNCPFDGEYRELLRPILFCIIYMNFEPKIASASLDSGQSRLDKIVDLIKISKYAIHDLSRIVSKKKGEVFRFNMPFELGLDVGCRIFSSGEKNSKKCLVLEAERYRDQRALSDLSGSDIESHGNEPIKAMRAVRGWLCQQEGLDNVLGPEGMFGLFTDFMAEHYDELCTRGFSSDDIENINIDELIRAMKNWVAHAAINTNV